MVKHSTCQNHVLNKPTPNYQNLKIRDLVSVFVPRFGANPVPCDYGFMVRKRGTLYMVLVLFVDGSNAIIEDVVCIYFMALETWAHERERYEDACFKAKILRHTHTHIVI